MSASGFDHTIQGKLFEPGSAKSRPVRLVRQGACVALLNDAGTEILLHEARDITDVSTRVAHIPREVRFPGGAVFETADNDGVDEVLARPAEKVLPWLERFHPRLVGIVFLAAAMLIGVVNIGVPTLARVAVGATPYQVEHILAEATLVSLDDAFFDQSQAPLMRRQALAGAFDNLLTVYRARDDARTEPTFELLFRAAPSIGPNAMALPGGQIVVTDELLELIADDETLVTVLAHEIGHVHHRHSLYKLYRSVGVGGLILFLGGDMSQLTETAVIQGAVLSNLASSRTMERQADVMGVELSIASGIAPGKLTQALVALTEACDGCRESSWLSTHPGLADRARRIERLIEDEQQRRAADER